MLWGELPLTNGPKISSVLPSSSVPKVDVDVQTVAEDDSDRADEELAEETDKEEL